MSVTTHRATAILSEVCKGDGISHQQALHSESDYSMILRCMFIVDISKDPAEAGNAKFLGSKVVEPVTEESIRQTGRDMHEQIIKFRKGEL